MLVRSVFTLGIRQTLAHNALDVCMRQHCQPWNGKRSLFPRGPVSGDQKGALRPDHDPFLLESWEQMAPSLPLSPLTVSLSDG